jgi:transcriptional regulator with XRE-family HTH domain
MSPNRQETKSAKSLDSQSDVAEKADISVNYYARIERNEENPTLETLERVLKALKLKSSDVLSF